MIITRYNYVMCIIIFTMLVKGLLMVYEQSERFHTVAFCRAVTETFTGVTVIPFRACTANIPQTFVLDLRQKANIVHREDIHHY